MVGSIFITGDQNGLTIHGYDYETSTEVHIPAEIKSTGSMLVSGRLLADIVKSLPRKPVHVATDGTRVNVTCGSTRFSLPTMPVEDYPTLPTLPDETGVVAATTFSEAVGQVAIAAGHDDTLPMLTGIRMELSDDRIVLAATDRFRLAVRELPWLGSADTAVLVPAKTLTDAAKMSTDGTDVHLALGAGITAGKEGLLGVRSSGKRTTMRLLDAEFPKFRQLLPAEHTAVATVGVAELTETIKRVALVAERGMQIRMDFHDNTVRVFAGHDDAGSAEENLDVEFAGEPLTIAFNPTFLTDGLASFKSDRVTFGFTSSVKPAVLWPTTSTYSGSGPFPSGATDHLYLLMPVRAPQ